MKKLEEIPKKSPFEVPDGYFDRLPGVIQSRISERRPTWAWIPAWPMALRYAIPLAVLAGVGIFWFTRDTLPVTVQSELASIQPDQLAAYLDSHELTTEDLVDHVSWSADDLDDLEDAVYSDLDVSHHQLEDILNEYDEL